LSGRYTIHLSDYSWDLRTRDCQICRSRRHFNQYIGWRHAKAFHLPALLFYTTRLRTLNLLSYANFFRQLHSSFSLYSNNVRVTRIFLSSYKKNYKKSFFPFVDFSFSKKLARAFTQEFINSFFSPFLLSILAVSRLSVRWRTIWIQFLSYVGGIARFFPSWWANLSRYSVEERHSPSSAIVVAEEKERGFILFEAPRRSAPFVSQLPSPPPSTPTPTPTLTPTPTTPTPPPPLRRS